MRIPSELLPGGRWRKAVAARLPQPLKSRIRARLSRTAIFPGPSAVATRDIRRGRPPARRVLRLELPPAPDGRGAYREVLLDVPWRCYIPKALQLHGLADYEPYALDCFLALLDLAPEGAVFDVGANIGLYGILASSYSTRQIHCFEPTPVLADTARDLAAANGLRHRLVDVALGAEPGTATFYLSAVTDASNSLNPAFRRHLSELDVPVERLDDYVARSGVHPSIIKVDTETTEPDVLAGASGYLAEHRPWVLVEVLRGPSEQRLQAVMEPHGYCYYHLDGPGPRPVTETITADPDGKSFMYLLAPTPVPDELWSRMNAWRQVLAASRVIPDQATALFTVA